ncbi:amidohydrolase 2 [Tolypothrix tenuis PCC 7101]|uniref:Amidohydrolase 2 n=1 Tax=Tolypothrix tenuis PCC 7101 TaxID=231146 RepID=A0A1Z4N419_9CYAN|nr:amidohydrolase family protein [Aulosira sp. FACHB-113]BAZ00425.1 amidohydrolase 2 [Tolypothrix tenuis PCC 7101]BAZ75653.1 amidohydrolase 2 [Aulosira laxa NIES-50]
MTIALERPTKKTRSAQIREQLGYPIIDTDVHTQEFEPAFLDYLEQVGGSKIVDSFREHLPGAGRFRWFQQSWEERHKYRTARPPFWGRPTKDTLDLATITLPKLLHERLQEAGTDFAVLYPNLATLAPQIKNDEMRRAVCRAANLYHADIFRPYSDRITPIATIPLNTPEEGIEELEYAIKELGLKTIQIPGYVTRVIPGFEKYPEEVQREATWIDTFALDSAYDYDPFWAKCVELKVVPTTHASGMGWTSRRSISNYQYNHIGHFASAGEAFCKALFFGGVTRRFPTLKFAFLEGGSAWGASLYTDIIWHWETRNPEILQNNNPANIDREGLAELFRVYGGAEFQGRAEQFGSGLGFHGQHLSPPNPGELDEFAAAGITKAEDVRDRFLNHFYFGTESDDTRAAYAFNQKANPFGDRVKAFLGSDSGHWDVPDITAVTSNAYSFVERGIFSEEDLRYFLSIHPLELYTSLNRDFFQGTAIEKEAEEYLNRA